MKFHARSLYFWVVFVVLLVADQVIKAWVRGALIEGQSMGSPFPGIFEIKLTFNEGIAFGMLQGLGKIFAPIALLIAMACAWWSHKHANEPKLVHFSIGLLAAGAVGNLLDRLIFHRVTDMFWFRLINFPVFNLADACITVSVAMLLVQSFFATAKSEQVTVQRPIEDPE